MADTLWVERTFQYDHEDGTFRRLIHSGSVSISEWLTEIEPGPREITHLKIVPLPAPGGGVVNILVVVGLE